MLNRLLKMERKRRKKSDEGKSYVGSKLKKSVANIDVKDKLFVF